MIILASDRFPVLWNVSPSVICLPAIQCGFLLNVQRSGILSTSVRRGAMWSGVGFCVCPGPYFVESFVFWDHFGFGVVWVGVRIGLSGVPISRMFCVLRSFRLRCGVAQCGPSAMLAECVPCSVIISASARCGAVRNCAMRCGVVLCGAARCCLVRCGVLRWGAVWCGGVRCGAVPCSAVWYNMVWCYGEVQCGVVRRRLMLSGAVRCALVRCGPVAVL